MCSWEKIVAIEYKVLTIWERVPPLDKYEIYIFSDPSETAPNDETATKGRMGNLFSSS